MKHCTEDTNLIGFLCLEVMNEVFISQKKRPLKIALDQPTVYLGTWFAPPARLLLEQSGAFLGHG
jgi:hypothetical protein